MHTRTRVRENPRVLIHLRLGHTNTPSISNQIPIPKRLAQANRTMSRMSNEGFTPKWMHNPIRDG